MKKRYTLLIASLVFAVTRPTVASPVGGPVVTISNVGTGWGGEGIYVSVTANSPSFSGNAACTSGRYILLPTNPFYREILSLLIAAMHSGHSIGMIPDNTLCLNNAWVLDAVTGNNF